MRQYKLYLTEEVIDHGNDRTDFTWHHIFRGIVSKVWSRNCIFVYSVCYSLLFA